MPSPEHDPWPGPELPGDGPASPDDEASAKALQRSIMALVVLGILASGAIAWWSRPVPGNTPSPRLAATSTLASTSAPPPTVHFTDVTAASGVRFVHANGARGDKLLPETMGSGVATFDMDGDGDADLLFVNGRPWDDAAARVAPTTAALYRNDTRPGGPMRFTDVTAGSGLEEPIHGMGVACGDFDADGRVDLFLTGVGANRLLRNQADGRFEDITASAGLPRDTGWSTAAAWIDADRDGDLDLFVAHYVEWSAELDRRIHHTLPGLGRAYGQPWSYTGTMPRLFLNQTRPGGPPRFTDASAGSGLWVRNPANGQPLAKSLAVAPIDLNDDGWIDLVVANDTVQNLVFTNRHDGTFAEVGVASGIAFDAFGHPRGAMGIDAGRFRDDEALGIAIGNFANEMNALYVSQPGRDHLVFTDEAMPEGLGNASRQLLKFGLFFFDYDLDGRLDLLTANGHIEEQIERLQPEVPYRQPAQLFWNAGTGPAFVPVQPGQAGPDLFTPRVARGSAYADLDRDGDPDVVITQAGGPAVILRNDQSLGHHWLRLRLVGRGGNTGAVGAWVRARVQGRVLARQVMPTRSYLSQSELPIHLGLGNARAIEGLQVRWPDGRDQVIPVPDIDREILLQEPP
ncbi:MAG: CRTAC1 family protein [Verrucomicrobiota bacterium]|jgi:hypothetical protein